MNRLIRRRPSLLALLILTALVATTLRGPCRRAVRDLGPADRPTPPPSSGRILSVLDGDTVITEAGVTLRLIGLDAPELDSPDQGVAALAREAGRFLEDLVRGKEVRLGYGVQRQDRYGRTLAHLFLVTPGEERLVAEAMLRRGLASIYLVPPNLHYASRFVAAQREAVGASRGIWSLPVEPEPWYVVGAYRFHRPSCPHAQDIPRPRRMTDRTAILQSGKGPCRRCRP